MNVLFINIKELIQVRAKNIDFLSGKEMNVLPTIKNAFLLVENGLISNYGLMENCPETTFKTIDADRQNDFTFLVRFSYASGLCR